jgi:hypothetical protein
MTEEQDRKGHLEVVIWHFSEFFRHDFCLPYCTLLGEPLEDISCPVQFQKLLTGGYKSVDTSQARCPWMYGWNREAVWRAGPTVSLANWFRPIITDWVSACTPSTYSWLTMFRILWTGQRCSEWQLSADSSHPLLLWASEAVLKLRSHTKTFCWFILFSRV